MPHAYSDCAPCLPPLHRPSALDSFSALSGQVSTLTKQLRVDRTSSMQNCVFLPLQLSNDHDPQLEVCACGCGHVWGWVGEGSECTSASPLLQKATDGRLTFMHHEIGKFGVSGGEVM